MKIYFKNGSKVESINAKFMDLTGYNKRSFKEIIWLLGNLYNDLKWYQKLRLRIAYIVGK